MFTYNYSHFFSWLNDYRSLFPPELKILTEEIKILSRSTFQLLNLERKLLFPVIRKSDEKVKVEWFPAQCIERRAFFGPAQPLEIHMSYIPKKVTGVC
jgi:hypothetical protein